MLVKERFGEKTLFLSKVNPTTQQYFAEHQKAAYMGDFPTLNDINMAYGKNFAVQWLVPQICDLSTHTGAKNLTEQQQEEVARIISVEYKHLKITELLLFFHKFKSGDYGRFYGSVDPMVITCALKEFYRDRGNAINSYMQEEAEARREQELKINPLLTREQWERIKKEREQNEQTNTN